MHPVWSTSILMNCSMKQLLTSVCYREFHSSELFKEAVDVFFKITSSLCSIPIAANWLRKASMMTILRVNDGSKLRLPSKCKHFSFPNNCKIILRHVAMYQVLLWLQLCRQWLLKIHNLFLKKFFFNDIVGSFWTSHLSKGPDRT